MGFGPQASIARSRWRQEGSPIALETATYIDALVTSNPDGGDQRSTADDHLRLIKAALKRSFPMIGGAVSASAIAIGYTNDLSASVQAQLNTLRDGSATAANAVNARFAQSASVASFIGTTAWSQVPALNVVNSFTQPQFITGNSPYLLLDDNLSPADMQRWYIQAYAGGPGNSAMRIASLDDSGALGYPAVDFYKTSAAATPYATFFARPYFTGGYAFLHEGDAINAAAVGGVAAAGIAKLAEAQSFSKGQAITQVSDSGTSFTPNCDDSTMFRYVLGGACTIFTPTSPRSGMVISFHLIQDGTGSRTVSWSSAFKFAGGAAPTLSTAAGAVDVIAFQYDSVSGHWRQAGLNVS